MAATTEPLYNQLHPFLLSRKKLYQFLHLIFLPPTNILLGEIWKNANIHELEEVHEGGKILCHFFEHLSNEQITKENEEYQRLFVGPGPFAAPPWESYYRSREQLLFEEWMYQIRELYHQFGLQNLKENNEPDDHLLLELEFMIFLADLNLQETKPERILELIASQIHFLEKHLTIWIPFFCERIIGNTKSHLYLGAAMLLEDFLSQDLTTLMEVREVINR